MISKKDRVALTDGVQTRYVHPSRVSEFPGWVQVDDNEVEQATETVEVKVEEDSENQEIE